VGVPPQLSLDVIPGALAGGIMLAHDTVTLAGQVIEGVELSNTVMTCVQLEEFRQLSVAK
jgi:hypothetical protein